MNAIATVTYILCRLTHDGKPVVFLADTLQDGRVSMWDGKDTKTVGVDVYHASQPLNEADSEILRKKYAKASGKPSEEVFLRQRLPRVYRERPSVLAAATDAASAASAAARTRSDAQRARVAAEIAQTQPGSAAAPAQLAADTVAVTVHVPPQYAEAIKLMEDPRTAALILKIADTLKVAL